MNNIIHCLYIDDDVKEHEVFQEVLNKTNLPVHCIFAETCQEATEYLQSGHVAPPDFIFIDWTLMDSPGIDCMYRINQIANHDATEFVVLSGPVPPHPDIQLLYETKILFQELNDLTSEADHLKQIFNDRWN